MQNANEILATLEKAGARLIVEDGQIKAQLPPGLALDDTMRAAIAAHKAELIAILQARPKGLMVRVLNRLRRPPNAAIEPAPEPAQEAPRPLPEFQPGEYVPSAQMMIPNDLAPAEAARWRERMERNRARMEDQAFRAAFGQPPAGRRR